MWCCAEALPFCWLDWLSNSPSSVEENRMKRHTAAITLMFGAVLSILPLQAQTKAHRVLFAMTSPEEANWQLTLNNIRNLISGMAPDPVEIELVAYGPGIAFLKKDG